MTSALKVLFVVNAEGCSTRVEQALADTGRPVTLQSVDSESGLRDALTSFRPDVVLGKAVGAKPCAREALALVREFRAGVPFIVMMDSVNETAAVECLRAGAENYVLASNLGRLAPAIQEALNLRLPLKRLSPRQLEVLRLVSEGLTTREIATRLRLSVKTVDTHRATMSKRLGVRGIAGLVAYAMRTGVVTSATVSSGVRNPD